MAMARALKAQATVRPDGTGSLTMGDRLKLVQESNEVLARRAVMLAVIEYARSEGAPVQLEALDSRGKPAVVVVFPDGTAEAVSGSEPTSPASVAAPTTTAPVFAPVAAPNWAPPPVPVAVGVPWTGSVPSPVDETRRIARSGHLLRFSTGQTVIVTGAGLIGRKPESDQPDDELVTITDPARSVSRIHLEFGHEDGQMWVADRRSGNGSAIYRGRDEIVCVPGRRYALQPGNRVKLGDQFFTVLKPEKKA